MAPVRTCGTIVICAGDSCASGLARVDGPQGWERVPGTDYGFPEAPLLRSQIGSDHQFGGKQVSCEFNAVHLPTASNCFGQHKTQQAMAARKGVDMQVVSPYGTCYEGAVCPRAVQVVSGTDRMRAPESPTEVMTADYVADGRRGRARAATMAGLGHAIRRAGWREFAKNDMVRVGFGGAACDVRIPKIYCT